MRCQLSPATKCHQSKFPADSGELNCYTMIVWIWNQLNSRLHRMMWNTHLQTLMRLACFAVQLDNTTGRLDMTSDSLYYTKLWVAANRLISVWPLYRVWLKMTVLSSVGANQHWLCIRCLFRVLTMYWSFAQGTCFTHGRLAVSNSTVAQPKDQMSALVSLNRHGVEEDGWEMMWDELGEYILTLKLMMSLLEDSIKTHDGILS
jgi:hypothetical protein